MRVLLTAFLFFGISSVALTQTTDTTAAQPAQTTTTAPPATTASPTTPSTPAAEGTDAEKLMNKLQSQPVMTKEQLEWIKEKEMEVTPEFPKWLRDQWKNECRVKHEDYEDIKKCYWSRVERARRAKVKQVSFDPQGNPVNPTKEKKKNKGNSPIVNSLVKDVAKADGGAPAKESKKTLKGNEDKSAGKAKKQKPKRKRSRKKVLYPSIEDD